MKRRVELKNIISLITLIILFVVLMFTSEFRMVSAYNLRSVLDQTIQTIIGGLGVLFVIALGSIDLSIGALAAVSSTVGLVVAARFDTWWLMIPVTLIVALAVGILNGIIVSRFKVSSFMTTLAMLIGLRGVLNYFITDALLLAPAGLTSLNQYLWLKAGVMLVLLAIVGYVFEFTRLGRYCKAMGENEMTAKFIGINTTFTRIAAFAISGLMAGFVGLFQMAKLGGPSASMGSFMEMKVMMAIFMGSVLVTGGMSARIYKMLIGSFTITIIINGLLLSGVDTNYSAAVQGVLLMVVLFMTVYFNNKKPKIMLDD